VHGKVQTAPIDQERHAAIPGDSGVWVFILADMSAFAVFFLLFAIGRIAQPALYEASRQQLDLGLGLANTLILLSSGAFMARAARQARRDDWQGTRVSLMVTMVIGALFAVSKLIEWKSKIAHGVTLTTNEFFTYYFVFTGIHFLHFVIGIGVLAVLIARSRGGADSAGQVRWIEAGGAYWHMVDLLWIVLFAMLYLMRAG
jgi:nitric oxide reductase NorE protein